MNKLLFMAVLLIAFLFSGCIEQLLPEEKYSKNGFSFTCPKGWTLNEGGDYNNVSFLIICQNEFAEGITSFVLTLDEIDLNESIEIGQSKLEETILEEGITPIFEEIRESRFKEFNTLLVDYDFFDEDANYQGNILTLNCRNKNVILTFMEAVEDHTKNLSGIEKIKESIKCE